jgi:hypothetical protein
MQQIVNIINKLDFDSALFYGVGIKSLFFDKVKGEKLGIDQYDYRHFPRSWSARAYGENIQQKGTKKKFDVVVINDSKRYKDVSNYFAKALKNIKEGGKIILIDSMPTLPIHVTDTPKQHQTWCGDVYIFVQELISKGGHKVQSFDEGNGLTVIEIDESVEPKEVKVEGFEEWYFQRKKIMSNYEHSTD